MATKTKAVQAAEAKAKADAAAEQAKADAYTVAAGGSITSKRGLLIPGDEVTAALLSGGDHALQNLVQLKKVVKS